MTAKTYEAMTRFSFSRDGTVVRIWSTVPKLTLGPTLEAVQVLCDLRDLHRDEEVPLHEIALALEALASTAAYEILDRHGNGAVVYIDWP